MFMRLQPAPTNWIELLTLITQKYWDVDADDIRMKLMPSNRSLRKGFKNTLNTLTSSFKGAKYRMLSKDKDF